MLDVLYFNLKGIQRTCIILFHWFYSAELAVRINAQQVDYATAFYQVYFLNVID